MTTTTNPEKESASRPFVISRTFDVPREKMWKAWTERDRLVQWFGPKGIKIRTASLDFRPVGTFHYCMEIPDGKQMWGKFVYRESVAPERIVWVNSFSDESGGVTRHPFNASWPLELLSVLTLSEQNGKTTATLEWSPIHATQEERQTFDGGHDSMRGGWTGTFDQLEEYLRKA
jgi:uncharacterized protein YndB with AHSA1/START domain